MLWHICLLRKALISRVQGGYFLSTNPKLAPRWPVYSAILLFKVLALSEIIAAMKYKLQRVVVQTKISLTTFIEKEPLAVYIVLAAEVLLRQHTTEHLSRRTLLSSQSMFCLRLRPLDGAQQWKKQ